MKKQDELKAETILDIANNLSEKDKKLIVKAFEFSKKAHAGEFRFTGEPYFVHTFETAKNIAEFGMDAECIASGFLHDSIEDGHTDEKHLQLALEELKFFANKVKVLGIYKRNPYRDKMKVFNNK